MKDISALSLTVSKILIFKKNYLENCGQDHMTNINLHKSHNVHFCASSYRLRDINILNCYPRKLVKSRVRKTELTPFDSHHQPL